MMAWNTVGQPSIGTICINSDHLVKLPIRYTLLPPYGQTKRMGTKPPIPSTEFWPEFDPKNICLDLLAESERKHFFQSQIQTTSPEATEAKYQV